VSFSDIVMQWDCLLLCVCRGVQPYDAENTLFVEEKRGAQGNVVLRSQHYFIRDDHQLVIEGVEDFELKDEYLFATKRQVQCILTSAHLLTQLVCFCSRSLFQENPFILQS